MKKYKSPVFCVIKLHDAIIATSPRIAITFGTAAEKGDEGCVSGRRGMEDFE